MTVERVDLVPGIGQLAATMSLRATSKEGNIKLGLTGQALVLPSTITPGKGDNPAHLHLRIEPTSIQPSVDIGFFSFAVKRYWASLATDLVRLFADPDLFAIKIPFADRAALSLGIDETKTEKV